MEARKAYYEALDSAAEAITDRFAQQGTQVYSELVKLILCAVSKQPILIPESLRTLYQHEFTWGSLEVQLKLVSQLIHEAKLTTISEFASWLKASTSRPYLSEVERLVGLILTLPATNAASERTFSTLKRVKTYLRSTMSQQRLNALLMLHTYKDLNDLLDPEDIIKIFVSGHSDRKKRIATV